MKILITGASGQVGAALAHTLGGQHQLHCPSHRQFDLADHAAMRAAIRHFSPDLLINCAAYTAVDAAEDDPDTAHQVNGEAPAVMAAEMETSGGTMIQYSSDYVFAGDLSRPYRETDTAHPLSVYGHSKLAGEESVLRHCEAALILRLSWVYGEHGRNFLKTILALAQQRTDLEVVDDQIGAPTWSGRVALTTQAIVNLGGQHARPYFKARRGRYHLCAAGMTSWHGYAQLILAQAARHGMAPLADLHAVATSGRVTRARRPANSRLDCTQLEKTFGLSLPPWQQDMVPCLERLLAQPTGQDLAIRS